MAQLFKSMPASRIVRIVASALDAGGAPRALHGAMVVKAVKEGTPSVFELEVSSKLDAYFDDVETINAVQSYFKGITILTRTPRKLIVTVQHGSPTSATLQGGKMPIFAQAEETESMGIVIDGSKKSVTDFDLSTQTSYSNIASALSTQLGVSVTFASSANSFVITSSTTGEASTISYASGALAQRLKLTQTDGAVLSNGLPGDTNIVPSLDRLVEYTRNFGSVFTAFEMGVDEATLFAEWINFQNNQYWGIPWTNDPRAEKVGQESIGTIVQENNYGGSTPLYAPDARYAAAAASYMASLNFSETRGRATLEFKVQEGLPAVVTDTDIAIGLENNGYMYYGAFATATTRFLMFRNSIVSGQFKYVDTYANQIYFSAQSQQSLLEMLLMHKAIPYNELGVSFHRGAMRDPIAEMINFGGIVAGVQLSGNQESVIRAEAGEQADACIASLYSNGYYLLIDKGTAQIRSNRDSMPMKLWYTDGGSVFNVDMASINVL